MAKRVCYTNIYKALRKSYDSGNYEDVNADWSVLASDPWGRAVLHSYEYDKTIRTGSIVGCTSMTDYLKFATSILMSNYNDWAAKALVYERCVWKPSRSRTLAITSTTAKASTLG